MQDTFYVVDKSGAESAVRGESQVLLRTQTSGVQAHVMETQAAVYIIAPGKDALPLWRPQPPAPQFSRSRAWWWTGHHLLAT